MTQAKARFRILLCALFILMLTATHSWSDDLKIGDSVQMLYRDGVVEGVVVTFSKQNRPVVKFTDDGREKKITCAWNKIRRIETPRAPQEKPQVDAGDGLRIWTNSTGKFKISAALLKNEDGEVQLKKEDGSIVTLPESKLSKVDQDWLIARRANAESSAADPTQIYVGKGKKPPTDVKRLELVGDLLEPVASPDVPQTELELKYAGAKYVPVANPSSKRNLKTLTLPALKEGEWGKWNDVSFQKSPNGRFLGVGASYVSRNFSEITVFDLETGNSKTVILPLKKSNLLAVSSDGTRLFTQRWPHHSQVDLWEINENGLNHKLSWKLTASSFAETWKIVDNLLIGAERSRIFAWDWENQSATYSIKGDYPALQINCQRWSIIKQDNVFIVDALNGEILKQIDTTSTCHGARISPNGENLITWFNDVSLWNLNTGELVSQRNFRKSTDRGENLFVRSATWLNDDQLLIDDSFLLDRDRLVSYWQFTKHSDTSLIEIGGGDFYKYDKTDKLSAVRLLPEAFPGEHAGKKVEDFLLLKPGLKVSLDLSELPFEQSETQSIRDSVVEKLQSLGVELSDSAPTTLKLWVTHGKKVTKEFIRLEKLSDITNNNAAQRKKIPVTWDEIFYQASLSTPEQEFWAVSISNTVSMLDRIPGKTSQQIADEITKLAPTKFLELVLPTRQLNTPDYKPLSSGMFVPTARSK